MSSSRATISCSTSWLTRWARNLAAFIHTACTRGEAERRGGGGRTEERRGREDRGEKEKGERREEGEEGREEMSWKNSQLF